MAREIVGMGSLRDHIREAVKGLKDLDRAVLRGGLFVAAQAKRNVTGGGSSREKLNVRSGRLRQSISATPAGKGAVAVGTNVVYAPIHEFGGKTPPHEIVPIRAAALAFNIGGKTVFARKVSHPGSLIPARPFLGPALDKERPRVVAEIRKVYAGPLRIGGAEVGGVDG